MAYATPFVDEEEKKKQEQQPIIGEPATISEAGGTGAPAGTSTGTGQSGQYTNLQTFLEANQPQAMALAGRIGEKFTSERGEAEKAFDTAQEAYRARITAGTPTYQADIMGQALQDPIAAERNQSVMDSLARMKSGAYTGPTQFTGSAEYTPAQKELQDVQTLSELTKTPGGIQQLLRKLPGMEGATPGGLTFNQMLLENVPQAKEQVLKSAEVAGPLGERFTGLGTTLSEDQARAIEAAKGVQTQVGQAFGTAEDQLKSQVEARVQTMRAQGQAQEQAIRSALTNGQVPAGADLQAMGMTPDQFQDVLTKRTQAQQYGGGINLQDYLTVQKPDVTYTPETVATRDEAARWEAFNRLGGTNNQYLTQGSIRAPTQQFNFNAAGASQALQSQIDTGVSRLNEAAALEQQGRYQEAAQKRQEAQSVLSYAGTGASIGAAVCNGIGAVVGGVIGLVVGLFSCFSENTPVLMKDGSVKLIQDIYEGDEVAFGGKVTKVQRVFYPYTMWYYRGAYMSGSHVIFDGETWMQVEDHPDAIQLEPGENVIWPITCENHLLVTSDFISADFQIADINGTDEQKIAYLNGWTVRNEQIKRVLEVVQATTQEVPVAAHAEYDNTGGILKYTTLPHITGVAAE